MFNERAGDRELGTLLRPGNMVNLQRWLWASRLDLLAAHPVTASVDDWLTALTAAAAAVLHFVQPPGTPDEVQLTVSAVRFEYQASRGTGSARRSWPTTANRPTSASTCSRPRTSGRRPRRRCR
ncbi:MAG: hypothetical protein R2742_12700 [Micropruina glycogenica]